MSRCPGPRACTASRLRGTARACWPGWAAMKRCRSSCGTSLAFTRDKVAVWEG
ncbi:hypothetical protein Micbo1qcDRAFT_158235 [Microdochium bolleyi]|uniref:Uncharacterized protein n=1 Tax=Microdochium bolleyi TaxID=196109 RepID=A0A136JFV7_9PEZI|nr:hypothetical protein Micbo1qcDRAFT_158235 [Microdochium bolleyi]